MYFSEIWIAFICECLIQKVITEAKLSCPGCKARLKCLILHEHFRLDLLAKIEANFVNARSAILSDISKIFLQFKSRFPDSVDLLENEKSYITNGCYFISVISPARLYYGNFINEFYDDLINQGDRIANKRKLSVTGAPKAKKSRVSL